MIHELFNDIHGMNLKWQGVILDAKLRSLGAVNHGKSHILDL